MPSYVTVKVQNANAVYNADTVNNTNHYSADGRLQSRTQSTVNGQPSGHNPRTQFGSQMPYGGGSLSSSPPEQDAPDQASSEADLPLPSDESSASADRARSAEATDEQDTQPAERASPQLRAPVAVEDSTDYISVRRNRDAGVRSEALTENPTAMSELKNPLPDNGAAVPYPYDREMSEQFSFEDMDLKRPAGGGHDPGDADNRPGPAAEVAFGMQNENDDFAVFTDGPELTPLNSLESGAPPLPDPNSMLSHASSSPSMSSREDGYASRGNPSPTENEHDSNPAEGERHCGVANQDSVDGRGPEQLAGSVDRQGGETGRFLSGSMERQGKTTVPFLQEPAMRSFPEPTMHSLQEPMMHSLQEPAMHSLQEPTMRSLQEPTMRFPQEPMVPSLQEPRQHSLQSRDLFQRSLQTDSGEEGGGGQLSTADDIFVFYHKNTLIQDDNLPYVLAVDVSPNESVLESGEKEGILPGGCSQLVKLKWRGHRDFDLSQWKLTLRTEASPEQTPNFFKHLCHILMDMDIECFRKVVKQLKLQHAIFLHSLTWDEGLTVCLGHTNPNVREQCMKSPTREAVQSILQQLGPGWAVDLAFQDPVALEEDTEDGRPPDLPVVESPISSVSASAGCGSGQTSPAGVEETPMSSLCPQPAPSESSLPDHSSSLVTDLSSSLMQVLGEIVENKCNRLHADKPHPPQAENPEELKQQLMNFIECERKTLEQKVQQLQHELEEFQSENKMVRQRLEDSEKHQEDLTQSMDQMRSQMQDQVQRMTERERAATRSEQQLKDRETAEEQMKQQVTAMEEKLKAVEERSSQLEQDQARAVEEAQGKMQQTMEVEMNKQMKKFQELVKEVQKAMIKQEWKLEELTSTVTSHEDIFRHLRTSQPQGAAMAETVQEEEGDMGAVGGVPATRNLFSSALVESEKTTSKMKGKDEEVQSNHMEDKINPMEATIDSFGRASEHHGMAVPSETEEASKEKSPSDGQRPGVVSAQGGARSKTSQKAPQSENAARTNGSPTLARKDSSVRESSQERAGNSAPSEEPQENFLKAEQFLGWIEFASSPGNVKRQMLKHVSAALKDEPVPAPRAKCLDTILCVDVSDSIISEGYLETVKTTAMTFVDGIEDMMNEMDMEENIAVVAVGGNARVVQHLTNDLTLVREAVESLKPENSGGRSPFMQALMVCLAANKGRGGVLNVAGVYKVRPRIIFITDGCPTDESIEMGPDLPGNISQTKYSLVTLLSQLASKKRKTIPRPISWVPIGRTPDQQFLQSLADLAGGELVMPENIQSLCRYYLLQQMIGRLLKVMKKQDDDSIQDDKMKDLLNAICSNTIDVKEKEFVVGAVKKQLKSPDEEDEPEADSFKNVFEDEAKVKNSILLPLGTRVVRGPHWKWKNQDTDGPGTVILHSKKDNWMYVKWDNGTHNAYRYGEGGKMDIVETLHHPRQIPPDSDRLDFGVRVVRGPDWKKGSEDGSGPGTVIRCRESDGRVKVRWDVTGKIHEYMYNKVTGREVQVNLPEFPRHSHGPGQANGHDAEEQDDDKKIPMWKWRDEVRQWRLYDEATCNKLEMEYKKRPGASCIITRAGKDRRVSFKLMQEKTVDSPANTEVMREMVDEERKNDLLAIEMSLQE